MTIDFPLPAEVGLPAGKKVYGSVNRGSLTCSKMTGYTIV